jgi:predicted permease
VTIILPIIGLFLIGFAAKRVIPEPTSVVKWINYFIIYVSLPSIIFLKVPQLEFTPQVVIPAIAAWTWLAIGAAIVLLLSRWLSWAKPTEGALLLMVTMGNTSFLGYPMVLAFFDDATLAYAIFFDQLGGFLILSTYGFIVVAIYSPLIQKSSPPKGSLLADGSALAKGSSTAKSVSQISGRQILKRVFSFPPFISLMIAFSLPIAALVSLIEPVLNVFALLLMPAALFVLGVQFQPKLLPEHRKPLIIGIALKMLMAPLVACLIVLLLNGSIDVRNATIFQAAMPSMVTPGLMAIAAGMAPRFVATMLGYCTLVSFITLPLIALILNS